MNAKFAATLFSAIALAGCAQFSTQGERETVLFNPVISAQTLEVSVMSNGCTEAKHFYLKVVEQDIELRRTQPDVCRAAPHLIRLAFDYPFSGEVFQFRNTVRFSNRVERR